MYKVCFSCISMLSRLQYFPIGFFSAVMGLSGFAIASAKLSSLFPVLEIIADISFWIACAVFFCFVLAYSYKLFRFFSAVKEEFFHPIFANFFPAFPMATLLLSLPMQEYSSVFSLGLWTLGMVVQFIFTISIFSRWVHSDVFKTNHITPVWFLPLVGNLLIPITGLSHAPSELLWFFYSFGTFFWLIITTLFLNRIFFHEPLPARLSPTFFILLAPPSLVVLSSLALGETGTLATMAYYIGLFLLLFLLSQLKNSIPDQFFVSWWAYSFPLAAFTSASYVMGFVWIASFCYALLTVVIVYLLFKTAIAMKNGEICKGH